MNRKQTFLSIKNNQNPEQIKQNSTKTSQNLNLSLNYHYRRSGILPHKRRRRYRLNRAARHRDERFPRNASSPAQSIARCFSDSQLGARIQQINVFSPSCVAGIYRGSNNRRHRRIKNAGKSDTIMSRKIPVEDFVRTLHGGDGNGGWAVRRRA